MLLYRLLPALDFIKVTGRLSVKNSVISVTNLL